MFDDPVIPAAARAFLDDPHHHLAVAVVDDEVVGFGSAVHTLHPDKVAPELWINEIGVSPLWQRRGLGTALVEALLARGHEVGCHEAWLLTERDNTAAMRLYQSLGGVEAPQPAVMFTFNLV